MARSQTVESHAKRMQRVRDHIRANLDQPINLDQLADIACLSRFHWHRVYRGLAGETIWQTVRRMRLQRAAADLAAGTSSIADITARSGYANPRAFTQAFKAEYGMNPQGYRASGGHRRYDDPQWQERTSMFDVRIESREAMLVCGLPHSGSYLDIGATFARLGETLGRAGCRPGTGQMTAVYFDDPDITPEAQLRALAGMVFAGGNPFPPDFSTHTVPAGRHAVLTHKGPYAELGKAYAWFFGQWLPASGETPMETPPLEIYLNTPMNAAPAELLTEIHMLLAG